ncbi:MAG TPA: gamma-glutamyltransferase [Gaiellaceae bacterium]|nr:gamma-glutamyltransferase [Gaiellaceae bacterium]
MNSGVAAGHPATAEAGAEILAEGGSAADAAVAAGLASCVAETVMTGLLGGGHAIHWDAARGEARLLDCFCAVPSGSGGELAGLDVPFGEELVHYGIGAASCAVPGVPAGLGALWEAHGRLPWPRLVEPALRLAREGVAMPPAHAACLEMLAPVMTMREGGRIYAPRGSLLRPGDRLRQPGLVGALESLAVEGAAGAYTGTIGEALLALSDERGGLLTAADLESYAPRWDEPVRVRRGERDLLTRGGLSGVPAAFARLPDLEGRSAAERTLLLLDALDGVPGPETHTTNLVAVDADANACVLTTSLGLGSGDWLPGLDLHLNSMLGETDLLVGPLEPGARMQSMMAPTLAVDRDGLVLAVGAAGGTRLRTALVGVAAAILDEEIDPQEAVDRPRVHVAAGVVNAEPGVDEIALERLEAAGLDVRRWPARHHYFGGVSASGRRGAAADPRRSGSVAVPPARA